MKKRLIYICMFASLLTFSSCNEALDVAPDGRLSLDEVFQDPDLTKAYFSTCFDYLPKKSLRYHFWSNYPVALSDEAWDCTDGSGAGFANHSIRASVRTFVSISAFESFIYDALVYGVTAI